MTGTRSGIDGATLQAAAKVARLWLSEERSAVVGPALQAIFQGLDRLDELELDESPPAALFDPRW